jgi:16S rRNA (cytidine1402-2'-O)-methyltransferase
MENDKGSLYLIPTVLGICNIDSVIPHKVLEITRSLKYFIVENERIARRYLKLNNAAVNIDKLNFMIYDEHSHQAQLKNYLNPVLRGYDTGLLSEAGCPAVADPGSKIVRLAHKLNIRVIPLVGPSSVILALMSSGLNGQNFVFAGYLPVKKNERIAAIRRLEQKSLIAKQTQIFIETPYRNNQLLSDILLTCQPSTLLCIASQITTPDEYIKTKSIKEWKANRPDLNRKTTIFLLY